MRRTYPDREGHEGLIQREWRVLREAGRGRSALASDANLVKAGGQGAWPAFLHHAGPQVFE